MALGVNKVILIGNVGKDPEVRTTGSGTAVTNVRLAVSERRRDGSGGWREYTDWVTVVCFGRTADLVGNHVQRGKLIYVEGRLQNRNFKSRDGGERWTTEVVADEVIFLGGGDGGGRGRDRDPGGDDDYDDDGDYDD